MFLFRKNSRSLPQASAAAVSATPSPAETSFPDPSLTANVKVNLGCGWDKREGWLNVDLHAFHSPDLVADVTHIPDIADQYADHALAQDILEHIHRARCGTALREWNRILKIGGTLEIRVPDVMAVARLMAAPERQTYEQHRTLIQCVYGTQAYDGDFHLNGFSEITLRHEMRECGFVVEHIGHTDEWLFRVIAKKVENVSPDPLLAIADHDEFLNQAYQRHLKRQPDPAGRAEFTRRLEGGTPREVILEILSHGEQ